MPESGSEWGGNIVKKIFVEIAILPESSYSTLAEGYVVLLVPDPDPNEGA